jgi:putative hydrolase of the HAD superfamily
MPRLTTIGFDADDTLWENERHYHVAKHRFAALLAKACNKDSSLAVLDEIEVRNVSVYGCGIKSYSLSMMEAAARLAGGVLDPTLIDSLLAITKDMLRAPVELIDGVVEALDRLAQGYTFVLLTKGDLFEQEAKIRRSGIGGRFQVVRVLYEKTAEVYRQVLRELGVLPDSFLMVGNSLRSDILPVLAVGARAVFVPHPLTWSHEHVAAEHMPAAGWVEITSIADLPDAIRAIDAE